VSGSPPANRFLAPLVLERDALLAAGASDHVSCGPAARPRRGPAVARHRAQPRRPIVSGARTARQSGGAREATMSFNATLARTDPSPLVRIDPGYCSGSRSLNRGPGGFGTLDPLGHHLVSSSEQHAVARADHRSRVRRRAWQRQHNAFSLYASLPGVVPLSMAPQRTPHRTGSERNSGTSSFPQCSRSPAACHCHTRKGSQPGLQRPDAFVGS
jgi:hypothetical protein